MVWYDSVMNNLRLQAQKLRDGGYSYSLINKKLGVSKSTLSNWFRDRPFIANNLVLKRVQYGPIKSGEKRHNNKVAQIKELLISGKEELGIISKRDLWMLGLGIYLGEGTKDYDNIRIINSNPDIIKISIKWFKEIIGVTNGNLAIRLHIYPDNNEVSCINFWSKSVGLPFEYFYKSHIDRRKNKTSKKSKKLPFGTAHLIIKANGNNEYGVKLARRIKGWIYGVTSQAQK